MCLPFSALQEQIRPLGCFPGVPHGGLLSGKPATFLEQHSLIKPREPVVSILSGSPTLANPWDLDQTARITSFEEFITLAV